MTDVLHSASDAAPVRPFAGVPGADAIRVRGIGKSYSRGKSSVQALADVSLRFPEGSFTALIGRSGCGKSTLLRLIAGLVPATAGDIVVHGETVNGPSQSVRYVFQDYSQSLFPWKSVIDNVVFGIESAGAAVTKRSRRDAAAEYLKLVGLEHTASRYPWELSGGMQQRVAIVRALASQPRVLLMDEPFSAVDALSRAALQDLILRLWSELGITVVLVTHDIDEAIYLADRVIVLAEDGFGVIADEPINLERPRAHVETRETRAFAEHRRRLFELIVARQPQ